MYMYMCVCVRVCCVLVFLLYIYMYHYNYKQCTCTNESKHVSKNHKSTIQSVNTTQYNHKYQTALVLKGKEDFQTFNT